MVGCAGRIAANVTDDQAGEPLAQPRAADAQPVGRAGREVLHEDVGTRQHGLHEG